MLQRFGLRTGLKSKHSGKKRIWIHALSVGEVKSSLPFVTSLKKQHRNLEIIFTASTKTGFDMANKLFLKKGDCPVDQLGYFPFDLAWSVKKIRRSIEPDSVIIVETDLWPNFLHEMKKNKIPVVLINARLSKRSFNRYLFFRKFSAPVFSKLTMIMAQTTMDKERFQCLGIDPERICVTGNIKFDQPLEDVYKESPKAMREQLGLRKGTKVFVAGSTHEGEENILCEVYKKMKKSMAGLVMIIAPRNPNRCLKILSYFLSNGIQTGLMSKINKLKDCPEVILVDKMGELFKLYSLCDVAFIGGSMVKQGGHNPLEPAAFSKPILFGNDMSDFLLISTWLMDSGGAKNVDSKENLTMELENLLLNRQERQHMGHNNFEVFSKNCGAVKRIIKNMEQLHIV